MLTRLVPGIITCAVLSGAAGGEEWPQFRGPRGDGTWHGPSIAERWPAEGLKQLWRQTLGGGYAGVVVADGRAITLDRRPAAGAQPEVERVVAFDVATGEPLWEHAYPVTYGMLDYGNGPRAAATVVEGSVYTLGAVGHVHCLEAATGRVVWRHDLVADFGAVLPTWGLAASPVVVGKVVLIHGGVQPNGCLVAFDRQTGREVWRSGGDPAGYATPLVVPRADHTQIVCWSPEHVLGFDLADGQELWRIPYKVTYGVSIAAPVVAGDLVFVSGYWEGSKAIRLGSGPRQATLAWEEPKHLQGLMSQPLVRDGHAYLLDKSEGLTCFELATGRKLWDDDHRLTPRGRNPQATLVWTGKEDRVLALNALGELILARLNPEGYTELARSPLVGETWAHPAYADHRVLARTDTEIVAAELPPAEPAR